MAISEVICNSCGKRSKVEVFPSIDAQRDPEVKARLLSGELFLWECPECGARQLLRYPLMYVDNKENLLICLSQAPIRIDDLQGRTGRLVSEPGELIEKIKIFDAGLDDIALELVKYVTLQDMKKDTTLRFLRFEGADNELVFTYPEDGKMQMIALGFSVYEHCLGIKQRNPSLKAEGLCRIDDMWLKNFIG